MTDEICLGGNWQTGYKHQARAGLNQTNPVSGTKYEWKAADGAGAELGNQENVRIIGIMVKVTWTVQPSPLECFVTVDGQELPADQIDAVSGDPYYINFSEGIADKLQFAAVMKAATRAFLLEGDTVKIEFETTGGTVQNLSAYVLWAKK